MSGEDPALLENTAAMDVWKMLAERYPDRRFAPETSMQLDLDVDSLGWVNLTLEIGEKTGVELDEEAVENVDTVRDLLREVASGAGGTARRSSPLERPEEVLDDRQRRWLRPLGPRDAGQEHVLPQPDGDAGTVPPAGGGPGEPAR